MDIPFEVNDELAWENPEGFKEVKTDIVGQSRWATFRNRVITNGEHYYRIDYVTGSTEQQDIGPNVEVTQVYPKTVSTVIYVENLDA